MPTRQFTATVSYTVHLDQQVLDDMLGDRRESHPSGFTTPEDLAEHVGLNVLRGTPLSQIDGFSHLDDGMARVSAILTEFVVEDEGPVVDEKTSDTPLT